MTPRPSNPACCTRSTRCSATPCEVASPTLTFGLTACARLPRPGSPASAGTSSSPTKPSSVPRAGSVLCTTRPAASAARRNPGRSTPARGVRSTRTRPWASRTVSDSWSTRKPGARRRPTSARCSSSRPSPLPSVRSTRVDTADAGGAATLVVGTLTAVSATTTLSATARPRRAAATLLPSDRPPPRDADEPKTDQSGALDVQRKFGKPLPRADRGRPRPAGTP